MYWYRIINRDDQSVFGSGTGNIGYMQKFAGFLIQTRRGATRTQQDGLVLSKIDERTKYIFGVQYIFLL